MTSKKVNSYVTPEACRTSVFGSVREEHRLGIIKNEIVRGIFGLE
jgi:hypothetical protein